MTLHEYIEDMRGKRIAIIGIGVSNTPLLELLLAEDEETAAARARQAQPAGKVDWEATPILGKRREGARLGK